ncbi:hypothetical protein QJS10_CPB11g01230 [Acorus calamus]|uniref:SUI1 domain-containing protein n=1 Tax=Acorus calamus TaxID=4465 RepID=A0AAV9DQB5_ACOCL|nr:hypothetical protein QJS10_CPB11g01230 [Acorus calamus]
MASRSRFPFLPIKMSTFFTEPLGGEKLTVLLMDKEVEDKGKGPKMVTCVRILDNKVKNLDKLLQDLRQDYSINGIVVKGNNGSGSIEHIELEGDRRWDAVNFLFKHRILTRDDLKNIKYLNDPSRSQLIWGVSVIETGK